MSTGSRVAIGFVVGAGLLVVLLVAGVVLALGASGQEPDEVARVSITVSPADPDAVAVPRLLDELEPTTLLTVTAAGFAPDTTGRVAQCLDDGARSCRNSLAVRFDSAGNATFQYLISDAIGGEGGCRLDAAPCTVEIRAVDDVASIATVFVDAAPPLGRLALEPARSLTLGQEVTLVAEGFPAGATFTATVCASPATRGPRCGPPGPELSLRADDGGNARATFTLDVSDVGPAGVACGRRTNCQIVVHSDDVTIRAQPVQLRFVASPGAIYDDGRLLLGLLVAAALAAAATHLVLTTDWRPPGEADGSLIDDAVYADLDAEAAVFEAASSHERMDEETSV